MDKQLRNIGALLVGQVLILFFLFFYIAMRAGETEHARMNDEYVATIGDKIIGAVFFVLCSPMALLIMVLPPQSRTIFEDNLSLALAVNSILTGLLLLVASRIFHKVKSNYRVRSKTF